YLTSYGGALKLLRLRALSECKEIVQRSFGSFLALSKEKKEGEELRRVEERLVEADELLTRYPAGELRAQKYLEEQESQMTCETVESLLPFVSSGCMLTLKDSRSAVLLDDAPPAVRTPAGTICSVLLSVGAFCIEFSIPVVSVVLLSVVNLSAVESLEWSYRSLAGEEAGVLLLLADGSLLVAQPSHIASLLPEQSLSLDSKLVPALLPSLPPLKVGSPLHPGAWEVTVDGMLALARREGEVDLLSAAASLVPMVKPEPPSPAVLKQAAYQLCSLDEAVVVDQNE
ncbi:MAG: hypothetical protein SGPRY_013374, partial [Prymnesium sp.]